MSFSSKNTKSNILSESLTVQTDLENEPGFSVSDLTE